MKPLRAWAIKHVDDGIHPHAIFESRKMANESRLFGREKVVRVEIREIKKKKKKVRK